MSFTVDLSQVLSQGSFAQQDRHLNTKVRCLSSFNTLLFCQRLRAKESITPGSKQFEDVMSCREELT